MADGQDILQKLFITRNGRSEIMQTIRNIEDVLERLTKVQDSFRNESTPRARMIKAELDHLVRIIISGASAVYAKELKGVLRP